VIAVESSFAEDQKTIENIRFKKLLYFVPKKKKRKETSLLENSLDTKKCFF